MEAFFYYGNGMNNTAFVETNTMSVTGDEESLKS